MSVSLTTLEQAEVSELAVTVRNAGVAGAGGAGFPTYAKWRRVDEVDYLLVNHQESEPNYFMDKWLGRTRRDEFAELFDALLEDFFDAIVVTAKEKEREEHVQPLETAIDATVRAPDDLPLDMDQESGAVVAYTDDRYEYGMESVLLRIVGDVVVGDDLPMDHGWIVQNTETMHDIYRALAEDHPVTTTYVHVDGNVPEHRFLEVPIGTPASDLLEAAGRPASELPNDAMLADGGPGWCFWIDDDPDRFGVRKRTNCVLVLDENTAWENTLGEDRINVLGQREWTDRDLETEPSETLEPEYVRVPLITNPAFEGPVAPSRPIVEAGDRVEAAEMIATPADDGFSIPQHSPIAGTVAGVDEHALEIEAGEPPQSGHVAAELGTGIGYPTWCMECGTYVIPPTDEPTVDLTSYVCENCS